MGPAGERMRSEPPMWLMAPDQTAPRRRRGAHQAGGAWRTTSDALDRLAVPRLGLSPPPLAAIAIGGALGTLARYLLDATFTETAGHFPTVTLLINLSGSLAIGFLVPLVDNFAQRIRWVGRSSSWGSSAGGPRTPPWPSTPSR